MASWTCPKCLFTSHNGNHDHVCVETQVEHEVRFNSGLDEEMYREFWAECKCGWAHCGGSRANSQKAWDDHIDSVIKEWASGT